MRLNMLNDSRVLNMTYRYKRNYFSEYRAFNVNWELRKAKWSKNAELAPSLFTFLKENFYDNK